MSGIGSAGKLEASGHGFGEKKQLTEEQQTAINALANLQLAAENLHTTPQQLIETLSAQEQEGLVEAVRIVKTI